MRNIATLLLVLALVVFAVVIYRVVTGGVPGPKTYSAAALGVALLVASLVARRRPVDTTTTTTVR